MLINITALKEKVWCVTEVEDGLLIEGTFDVEPLVFDMVEQLGLSPANRDRLTGQVTTAIHSATLFDAIEESDFLPKRRKNRAKHK